MPEEEKGIKSAFELAMERLKQAEPDEPGLSEKQKRELAEIDRETGAKVAEQEILFRSRIQAASANRNLEEVEKLRQELATEIRRIRERGESRKEEVRRQAS
jgi:hypothetical protein